LKINPTDLQVINLLDIDGPLTPAGSQSKLG